AVVADAEIARLEGQRFAYREKRIEHQFLRHHAERAPRCTIVVDHVKSHDPGGTARGEDQAGEDIDQRRLAGAIRAEAAEEFARVDLQTYFVERRERAIALGGALYLNGGNQGTYLTCRCAYAFTVHCSPSNSVTP